MAEYYLNAQLPSLDGIGENAPLPITQERFLELCDRFLGKKARKKMETVTLVPPIVPERSPSALIEAWNDGERHLRLALRKARAEKMGKSFDLQNQNLPITLCKVAFAAVEAENPLAAEQFLLKHRLDFLETLRPMDIFSEYLFYYALKLKLLLRIRSFDTAKGEQAYRNIYSSILRGDGLEEKS